MDVLDAIYHRRAVRDFSDRPVSVDTIRDLIDAAIQAPSAMNLQPWGFAVVTDRRKLAAISKQAKAYLLDHLSPRSPLLRLRDDLASPAFNIFYNAPVLEIGRAHV